MKKIKIEILCDEFYVADSLHELASNIECGDLLDNLDPDNPHVNGDHYTATVTEVNIPTDDDTAAADNDDDGEAPFFTIGTRYRCTKTVTNDDGEELFTAGIIYDQYREATIYYGWLRNNHGHRHGWPQPREIAQECDTWNWKPEDIDPRNYFEPVND